MARTQSIKNKAKATPAKETLSVKDIVQEAIDNNEVEVETTDTPTTERKVKTAPNRDMYVSVMNATSGSTIYKNPKSGATWVFNGYGVVDQMDVATLMTMKSSEPKFLTEPWLIILDDEVVDYLGLTHIYDNILKPDELELFFKLPVAKMEDILKRVPNGVKELIASTAMEKIENDELYDTRVIRVIESVLGIELID